MKTAKELREEADAKLESAKTIFSKDGVTAEELSKASAMMDEAEQLQKQAEQQERLEKMEAKRQEPETSVPLQSKAPKSEPAQARDPEDRGPFKSLGEQLIAIKDRTVKKIHDERFDRLEAQAKISGINETIDDEGAILIQPDFAAEIFKVAFNTGILASRVRRWPISSNQLSIRTIAETSRATGSRWGGVQMYWEGEGDTTPGSKPKFGKINFKLKKLKGVWYVTEEMLEDLPLMSELGNEAFQDEAKFMVDNAIWEGTGVGSPLGMFNSPAKVVVAKEAAQAADTVVAANIVKMYARMLPGSLQDAIWLYNTAVFPQLMTMTIGNQPVFLPPGGLSGLPYGLILGRPALPFEHCSALGDAGDIAFIDPRMYAVAQKGEAQVAASMHVKFVEDEMTYKIKVRMDGTPLLESAITPFKGSDTLSSIVTLAERA